MAGRVDEGGGMVGVPFMTVGLRKEEKGRNWER